MTSQQYENLLTAMSLYFAAIFTLVVICTGMVLVTILKLHGEVSARKN